MIEQREVLLPLDHPSAAGHFPGNPIIPGAVMLSEVVRTWVAVRGKSGEGITIKVAKFLSPTRPGDRVTIRFEGDDINNVKFSCAVGEVVVLTGAFGVPEPRSTP